MDGADEFRRTTRLLDERRGVQRVLLGLVVVLFPVEIVQQPDDTQNSSFSGSNSRAK